jgi:predicted transcriptional regulator
MINEIKEHMNKHLSEFQDNTNKELGEIRKIIQEKKEEFSTVMEILKKK